MSFTFLVVLYDKSIDESLTFLSIVRNGVALPNDSELVIWNNGPSSIVIPEHYLRLLEQLGISVEFKETLENLPLSNIYNQVIENHCSDRFVILDDDSELTREYLLSLANFSQYEFLVPVLTSGEIRISPNYLFGKNMRFTALASGLCLSSKAVGILTQEFGAVFDERFIFYGADSTLCYRCHKLGLEMKVVPGFNHSLSFKSQREVSEFRKRELSISIGLQLRYYPNLFTLKAIFLYLLGGIRGRGVIKIKTVFIAFIKGRRDFN